MPTFLSNQVDWSTDNDMQSITAKAKKMILGLLAQTTNNIPSRTITISSGAIERDSFKLLGIYIDSFAC